MTTDGWLAFAGRRHRVALGRGGIRPDKEEGDGATPAGLLPLRRVFWRADRGAIPATGVPREPLAPEDGWCDDQTHRDYNTHVTLPHPGRHEALWREDALYDLIGVLGWNDAPVQRGRGSAIFLHVAHADLRPTDGCIALPIGELRALLAAGLSAVRVLADRG